MDVEVASINFDAKIGSIGIWHDSSVLQLLGLEAESKADVQVMDVHLDVTFGDKDTGLGSEVIDFEVGLQVVDLKSDLVGFFVGGENDIVSGLLNVKCNVMHNSDIAWSWYILWRCCRLWSW